MSRDIHTLATVQQGEAMSMCECFYANKVCVNVFLCRHM